MLARLRQPMDRPDSANAPRPINLRIVIHPCTLRRSSSAGDVNCREKKNRDGREECVPRRRNGRPETGKVLGCIWRKQTLTPALGPAKPMKNETQPDKNAGNGP